ncbi:class I SAM-dependent methyltransferase [Exiguobacterium indicum]|uniref:class I SAM-dependent rRNA methyltransferase n=1 Tax=Exiguobacterium TaxID=33986 RepID=UPI0003C3D145|nr:class I SAM-dependent methyltransferase [Exiguobacterium sp. MH3]AHA31091.1 pseudouridine synthase [Exiguobacterium sp. MH3]
MPRELYPIVVKSEWIELIRSGYPALRKEMFESLQHIKEAGGLLHLMTEHKEYLATGYFGKQEKGVGWTLSMDEQDTIDVAFFKRLFEQALDKRNDFFEEESEAFRIFNGAGDGIGGLTIDCYDHHYLILFENEGIYTFRPMILEALESLVHYKSIYEKRDFLIDLQPVKGDDFLMGERGDFPEMLQEHGARYAYDLDAGMRTGFDIAQRELRKVLMDSVKEKNVLNLFSDTGTLTVSALHGHATHTTSVDFSTRSRNKTTDNLTLNHFTPEEQILLVQDAFDYIEQADKKTRFDVVLFHPPVHVNTRTRQFRTEQDLSPWIQKVIHLTNRGGLLAITTDSPALDALQLKKAVEQAFNKLRQKFEVVWEQPEQKDFPTPPSMPQLAQKSILIRRK